MTDQAHAEYIRNNLQKLRGSIEDARKAGLTVKVPELVHLYLEDGTASGAPDDWTIVRPL